MTAPPNPPPVPGSGMQPVPVKGPEKPRLLQDGRDMFWSMAPLLLACVVLAGLLGTCSFAPNGPGPGPTPNYDASAALHADATALKFPVRLPRLPQGWRANSGSRGSIDGGRVDAAGRSGRAVTSRVGYLAPSGRYLSLVQSNADETDLIQSLDTRLAPTGVQDVDGVRWVVYQGGNPDGDVRNPVWTTRLTSPSGPAQIAITGPAGSGDYRTLASAVQTQVPLPVT